MANSNESDLNDRRDGRIAAERLDGMKLPDGTDSSAPHQPSHGGQLSLLLNFKRRRSMGEQINAKAFLAELANPPDPEVIIDLAFAEFLDAEARNEPGVDERLCAEFPEVQNELHQQIQFHRALQHSTENCETLTRTTRDGFSETANDHHDEGHEADSPLRLSIPGLSLRKVLGRGGMGVVYLAHQSRLNRNVAVKLLLGGALASNIHRDRFRAEAQAAAALRHPNIVQIDEVGEADGQPFIVMEYVDGGTLEQFLRRGTPAPHDAAQFTHAVAMAVIRAHREGIIHRDLKPGNILLAGCGQGAEPTASKKEHSDRVLSDFTPKVADFGLAKVMADDRSVAGPYLTLAGDLLGTPSYMAPEQVNGEAVGPWTDVYALGAILYHMLCGRPPFLSDSAWETMQHVVDSPPASMPRSVPSDLQTICLKCLRKLPSDRYPSMNKLAMDLDNFLNNRPIAARQISSFERVRFWCRRNKTVSILASLVFLALSTVLGISLWGSSRLQQLLNETEIARIGAMEAHSRSLENLWESLISEARAQQLTRRVGQRKNSLAAVKEARDLLSEIEATPERIATLRDTAVACLPLLEIEPIGLWKGPQFESDDRISFDRNLNRVAQLVGDSVVISENLGANEIFRFRVKGVSHITLSPDGGHVAVWGRECRVFNLKSTQPEFLQVFDSKGWWGFSAASDKLVGTDRKGMLVFDLESESIERRLGMHASNMPLAFSDDNRKVALVTDDSLLAFDFQNGKLVARFERPMAVAGIACLAWHPDSERIAAAKYEDNTIILWDTSTGDVSRRYQQPTSAFVKIGFDGNGRNLIASSPWEGVVNVFDVESEMRTMEAQGVSTGGIKPNSNGGARLLIETPAADNVIWEIQSQNVVEQFRAANPIKQERFDAVLSPDDRWLAVSGERGIELFDRVRRQLIAELPIGRLHHDRIAFDRTGRLWAALPNGWLRWTFHESGMGAPDFLQSPPGFVPLEIDHDGRWCLVTDSQHVKLQSMNEPGREVELGPHIDVRNVSFSRDGRYVVTGGWNGEGNAKIWNVSDGTLVCKLDTGPFCVPEFSPDGNFLITSPRGGEVWESKEWTRVLQVQTTDSATTGFRAAFSADSNWLAISSSNGLVQLWEVAARRVVGVLTYPFANRLNSLVFLNDQTELVCVNRNRTGVVESWNLNQLKRELDSMDIGFPAFEMKLGTSVVLDNEADLSSSAPFTTERTELYDMLIRYQLETEAFDAFESNQWKSGFKTLQTLRDLFPGDARSLNLLAWEMLIAPVEFCDNEQALALAEEAVKLDPSRDHINTLGAAQYRCFRLTEAVDTLMTSLGDGTHSGAAFDYYLLACCHAKLDHAERAESFLAQGITAQENPTEPITSESTRELNLLRAEAETCLAELRARLSAQGQ